MINCVFENGNKATLRHITVGALVVNDKNEILLTKRAPHLLRGNKYAIPGGFLDRDETTAEAAVRELLEETGIQGEIQFLFEIEDKPERLNEEGPDGRQNVDFVYAIKKTGGQFIDNSEVSEIKWFSENSIPKEEEFAFDHHGIIIKYFEHMKNPFKLPLIGGLQ
jgi:8-oxo-dGTP diphosphatase